VYAQDYVSHLVVENSKIKLLREYLNVISSARALLPKGLADVPAPANWVLAQAPHAPAARAVSRGGFRRAPA
jgi:hypothetical protein